MFIFVLYNIYRTISAYNISIIKLFILRIMIKSEIIDSNMISNTKQINSQPLDIGSQQQWKVSQIID